MDISFSNVLEGARQYFQGLPSPAANSTQPTQSTIAPPPAAGDPQPQRSPSNTPARFDNVPTSAPTTGAQQSTTASGSPSVLSYWPPISSTPTYQRKEVAATTMPQAHVVPSPTTAHHVKTTPNNSFNGNRPNPLDMNQSNYPAPQRPQGHNLPPIAALSNYHSSRSSRDSLTTPRIQPQASHASSKGFHRTQQSEYTLPRQNQAQFVSGASGSTARPQYGHQAPKYQQLGVVPSSVPTPTVSASYHSFPTTPASISMSSTSSSTTSLSTTPVSSHPQQPQFSYHPLPEQPSKPPSRQPQYPTQQLPYFNVSSAVPVPSQPNAMVNGHQKSPAVTPVTARPTTTSRTKRESPLDLSVKTVRQSADSTAIDDSEGSFSGRNYSPAPVASSKNRTPLPPLQLPSSVAYPTMDSRGAPRTPVTSNNSISKSIGAPKIDFLANFAAHQHSATPSTYGPESIHRPNDRAQNQQHYPQQHSSNALPHVGSFKNIASSGSFDHKQPPSVQFNHTSAQSSAYDAKQTPPVAYNHKLAQSAAAFNHKQAQSALYDSKYAQFANYNHKSAHSTPYNQKLTPPTNYDHNKQTQQAQYEIKQVSPATYEHKQTPVTTYEHTKLTQPTSYENSKQTQPTPYDPGKQTQSAAYEHHKQSQPASYDQSKQMQPSAFDQGKQPQPASYNHSKQMHLAAYDHNKQPQLVSYDHSKQAKPVSYNHSKSAVSYDNKQTQPTTFDHKQTAPASYDFKKLQPPNFDAKQTLHSAYDHNKQPQPSQYSVKHVQSGSFDFKGTQAPAFDHNSQTHPPTYEYKQSYDHKQPQYYPTATQPQHRQPSKPSPTVQSYPNNSHYTPPVPAGYDPAKRVVEGAPGFGGGRVDYRQVPNSAAYPNQGLHKRMMGEARHALPAKVPRLDTWRQTIDQQIEQRLSSYASSRQQQQQPINGNSESNSSTTSQDPQFIQRNPNTPRVNPPQPHSFNTTVSGPTPPFPNRGPNLQKLLSAVTTPKPGRISMPGGGAADKRVLNILRNTLEEKEARMTLLQNQLHHNAQLQQQYQQRQPHPPEAPVQLMPLQKPSLSPTLPPGRLNLPPFGMVVENAHTSQHKLHLPRAIDSVRLDQDSGNKKITEITRNTGIQQGTPSQELDGFAAYLAARIRTKAELKQVGPGMEHLNTSHHQSFRCPTPSSSVISVSNSSVHSARTTPGTPTVFSPPPLNALSGSEDKPGEMSKTISTPSTQANAGGGASSSGGSPPKLTRERGAVVPPRRRLFSRPDEEQSSVGSISGGPVLGPIGPFLPPRDLSGLRSSSETSVFDFRDSDSEGEMPVLERQTLNEMRKDRRHHPKQPAQVLTTVEEPSEPMDPFWSDTCDKFLEELRVGTKRGRGRRKKVDPGETSIKCEKDSKSELNENNEKSEPFVISEAEVKKENIEANTVIIKKEKIKLECSSNDLKKRKVLDSKDVPLRKRRARLKSEEDDVDDEISLAEIKARLGKRQDSASDRIISESELSDDESGEKVETVAERLRRRKRQQDEEDSKSGMRLRSKDPSSPRKTSEALTKSSPKKKKPHFGDGSDFTPGWEEQVYRFKRSLRMPARLINISRPPDASRLCASLPDLDPCPNSPAASTMDSSDFQAKRNTISSNLLRRWDAESDVESNSNISMPCESEEATSSSITSNKQKDTKCQVKEKNNSLLNLLVQKYGRAKSPRKKVGENKWLDRPGARVLPRKTAPELLPTPSLGIGPPKRGPNKKGKNSLKKKYGDDLKKDPYSEIKDSVYLGYFRRKTVTNFRDAFLQNGSSLGSPFAPIVFKSRTRTETRVMRQRATIREVFGEDRPASCPPTCREENLAVEEEVEDGGRRNSNTSQGRGNQAASRSAALLRSNKAVLNSKRHLLQGGRRRNLNLIRVLASKTLQELSEDVDPTDKNYKLVDLLPQISTIKAIAEGVKSENEVRKTPLVKRIKLRTGRRKFRSGFDYIRKKKKQQKKEDGDVPKVKKKAAISRPSSESVQDIQSEIRGWVINKGLGETLLHRAARLGYTDVAAYCLETLDNPASPRDNAGYTPLHEACSRGHLDIARLLLMYGANVSDSAQGGIRPLHEAAESGCMEMMRLLLSYGADPLLATYGGQTPLSLATDEAARRLLQLHLADVQGLPAQPWNFQGPASCCDPKVRGYDVLQDPPCLSPEPLEDDEIEIEISEMALPVLYRLIGEPPTDRWVLLQDLTNILRVKSKDALLRQLGPDPRSMLKELKMADFLEQARCCHLLGSGEKINIRASKVALVPYNEKVREILGVEKVTVSSR